MKLIHSQIFAFLNPKTAIVLIIAILFCSYTPLHSQVKKDIEKQDEAANLLKELKGTNIEDIDFYDIDIDNLYKLNTSFKESKASRDKALIALYLGVYYYRVEEKYTKSQEYLYACLLLNGFLTLDEKDLTYTLLADLEKIQKNIPNALYFSNKRLETTYQKKDFDKIYAAEIGIAAVYNLIQDNVNAKIHLNKAQELEEKISEYDINRVWFRLHSAYMYRYSNELGASKKYFNEIFNYSYLDSAPFLIPYVYEEYGRYWEAKKETDSAIYYFKRCLKYSNSDVTNDKFPLVPSYSGLGDLYLKKGDTLQAVHNYKNALNTGIKHDIYDPTYLVAEKLFKILPKKEIDNLELKDYLIASYTRRNTMLEGSKSFVNQFNEIKELDAKIEKAKKKQEILKLKDEQQKILLRISIIGFILIIVFLVYYFRNKARLKSNEIKKLKAESELTELNAIIKGEEIERKRISEDLHDSINGNLVSASYLINKTLDSGDTQDKTLNDVITILQDTIQDVRDISFNLSPAYTVNNSLESMVKYSCERSTNASDTDFHFHCFGEPVKFNKKTVLLIYRVIQEIVLNIIKHAQAKDAIIQFHYTHDDKLDITIEDDGKGFDVNKKSLGIGMINIKSRLELIKSSYTIKSNHAGTSFYISINLKNELFFDTYSY